jgi:hypothetical protein
MNFKKLICFKNQDKSLLVEATLRKKDPVNFPSAYECRNYVANGIQFIKIMQLSTPLTGR